MYIANVLADSVSPDGVRLTTLEVEYPHAVHKDIMTHRMLSRNFQSFRAFPPEKVIENIERDPFVPVFTKRVNGMANGEPLVGREKERAERHWNQHIQNALETADWMIQNEIGKDQINFVLQDLTWIRGIITATDWDNFFALRAFAPEGAKPRPEVERIAQMMYDAIDYSTPNDIGYGGWHLPMITPKDWCEEDSLIDYREVAVGRCARVSYLTHHGNRDMQKDMQLCRSLRKNFHMSPFEHVATPMSKGIYPDARISYCGNFKGWLQYRKGISNEHNMMETYEGPVHPYWRNSDD
jgi:thymidylate synthase ThyX